MVPLLLILAAGGFIAWQFGRANGRDSAPGDPSPDVPIGDPTLLDMAPAADAPATNAANLPMPKVSTWTPPRIAAPYLDTIAATEQANGIPTNLLARLLHQESRFRPDIIDGSTTSPVGAVGIAQFMPKTAKDIGVDPLDPASAIAGAGRYLSSLFKQLGTWDKALAGYNWGAGNVKRKGIANAPQETRDYVAQITADVPV
jgi:soluble lytic murein transglycosylase-like protein